MQKYIIRRLLLAIPTLLLVSVVIFTIMRVAPGDVALLVATRGQEAGQAINVPEADLQRIRHRLGTDRPLPVQYLSWLKETVTLNLGKSIFSDQDVWSNVKRKIPVSLELAIMTLIISLAISIPLGIVAAMHQDTWIDYVARVFSLGGLSMPNFWVGTMLLVGGLYLLDWTPPFFYTAFTKDPIANLSQMIWPALVLGYQAIGTQTRMMRSTMLEVLRQDYIRTAHAKGLSSFLVTYRHALKNALLPVVTIAGISFAILVGGVVIMEQIFVLPGLGSYLVEGMSYRDFPIVQPLVVLFAFWIIMLNLLVDISYAWLDPRIRYD